MIAPAADADAWFSVAIDHLRGLPAPFDLARTLLCDEERLRRAGRRRRAQLSLQTALQTFEQLGAAPWARRAAAELHAGGGRATTEPAAAPLEKLTHQEMQVALTVASGATNRAAAASLFLSPKTIEYHLSHVYRKLGVRTRAGLAPQAARRGWLDDQPMPDS